MKEITIKIPDNCELKQDGNNYTVVEKEKKLTYEDVARELFFSKNFYSINGKGNIIHYTSCAYNDMVDANNCTSQKQAEKLLAINKLMNVAKYLNSDWQPDWNNAHDYKWFIYFSNEYKKLRIDKVHSIQQHFVYFKSKELAEKAIEILGKETIKLALCTDY